MVPRCRFVGDDHGHFGTGYRHLVEMIVRSLALPSREIKAEKPEVDQSLAITSESHFFFICAGPRYLEEQPGNAAALRLGVDLLKCCNDLGNIHLSWLTVGFTSLERRFCRSGLVRGFVVEVVDQTKAVGSNVAFARLFRCAESDIRTEGPSPGFPGAGGGGRRRGQPGTQVPGQKRPCGGERHAGRGVPAGRRVARRKTANLDGRSKQEAGRRALASSIARKAGDTKTELGFHHRGHGEHGGKRRLKAETIYHKERREHKDRTRNRI